MDDLGHLELDGTGRPARTSAGQDRLFSDLGQPDYNRRLADKILAAFTHAWSVGERDVAQQLRKSLELVERRIPADSQGRRADASTRQADLWVEFVADREAYRKLSEKGGDDGRLDAAMNRMKDSYRLWSEN